MSGINMRQLVELLDSIESNERVYMIDLEILNSQKNKAIDVNMTIATLKLKVRQLNENSETIFHWRGYDSSIFNGD